MATGTLLTIEQFDALPERDDVRYELVRGELIEMPRPIPAHNLVRDTILYDLLRFLEEHPLGTAIAECELRLAPDSVRVADVAFIRAERMKQIDLWRRVEGAPDLAIEVVSPSDSYEEVMEKAREYLEAGARAVWVFSLAQRNVLVRTSEGGRLVGTREELQCPELLPGYSRVVEQFYRRL
jgi:Uma2 family endonuclease